MQHCTPFCFLVLESCDIIQGISYTGTQTNSFIKGGGRFPWPGEGEGLPGMEFKKIIFQTEKRNQFQIGLCLPNR